MVSHPKHLRLSFLQFMQEEGHEVVPGAALASETSDVLFTVAGMQQFVPYLRGREHPLGKRLCDVQRCIRTNDLEEVGDETHLTMFEMLGNWSLGDYGKKFAIEISWKYLTDVLGVDPDKLYVTCFEGDGQVPMDQESVDVWSEVLSRSGLDPSLHIKLLGSKDNWWSAGPVGPCGMDTEIFYYVGSEEPDFLGEGFKDEDFVEVWNNVFMTYDRLQDGSLVPLVQKNVDTGMGLERLSALLGGHKSVWDTQELSELVQIVRNRTDDLLSTRSERVVTDHLRAALAIACEGIVPSNSKQGYVLRRLLRRSLTELLVIEREDAFKDILTDISQKIVSFFPDLSSGMDIAVNICLKEREQFLKICQSGLRLMKKFSGLSGKDLFYLSDTCGLPADVAVLLNPGLPIDPNWKEEYDQLRQEQQLRSK